MNRKSRAGVLCILAALFVAFLFKFVFWDGLLERQQARDMHEARVAEEGKNEVNHRAVFERKVARAVTTSEWEALARALQNLPVPEKQRNMLSSFIAAKAFEARAIERDNLLYFTGKLVKGNENDPTAEEYFARARELHETNMRLIDTISERAGDCAWNKRLWYRKGFEYYRSLLFLNKGESSRAMDLIDQAIQSFEKVFSCFPKDRDAETAIELLYERGKKIKEATAPSEGKKNSLKEKLPFFPGEELKPGVGKSQQREEGRH